MTEACIIGWAHSPFGKLEDPDIESLIGRVAGAAIEDAGIAPGEIEASFISLFNNGFSKQDFPASLVLQHVPDPVGAIEYYNVKAIQAAGLR